MKHRVHNETRFTLDTEVQRGSRIDPSNLKKIVKDKECVKRKQPILVYSTEGASIVSGYVISWLPY